MSTHLRRRKVPQQKRAKRPLRPSRVQYTIRNVPSSVDRSLRAMAQTQRKSLNEIALEGLIQKSGATHEPRRSLELNEFSGSWIEDPEFEKALAAQSQIDPELWETK